MSAWDTGIFDNDAACDWAAELEEAENFLQIEEALDAILALDSGAPLEADLACEGLAAAEVIARSLGNWGVRNLYTEAVDQWVESTSLTPEGPVIEKAKQVVERILDDCSELRELWEDDEEWVTNVNGLRERLED